MGVPKGWDFRLLPDPLAGVQCSFEHKAAAGPPKSTFGGTLVVEASSCVSTAIHGGEVRIWEARHFHHLKPGSESTCFHHFKPKTKVDFHVSPI